MGVHSRDLDQEVQLKADLELFSQTVCVPDMTENLLNPPTVMKQGVLSQVGILKEPRNSCKI